VRQLKQFTVLKTGKAARHATETETEPEPKLTCHQQAGKAMGMELGMGSKKEHQPKQANGKNSNYLLAAKRAKMQRNNAMHCEKIVVTILNHFFNQL